MAKKRTVSAKNKKTMIDNDSLSGFTIIEVVLVLAIAGLIFLMVFIALPQLQRAQRDTQRRNDMAKVSSAITQFQTNNNGRLPGKGEEVSQSSVAPVGGVVPMSEYKCDTGDSVNDACRLIKDYINGAKAENSEFVDPDGPGYGITIRSPKADMPASLDYNDHMIYVTPETRCDGESLKSDNVNPRDYTVVYRLEGSGIYCQDNG